MARNYRCETRFFSTTTAADPTRTARDPILFGDLHQTKVYEYAGGDPINLVDPDGEFRIVQPGITIGVASSVGWATIINLAIAVLFSPDHDTRNVLVEKVILRKFAEAIPEVTVNGGIGVSAVAQPARRRRTG